MTQAAPAPETVDVDGAPHAVLERRLADRVAKVVVVGQGYVGLPVAMRAASLGFPTIGYELDATRIEFLRAGRSYVEDVTNEQLERALEGGYLATGDLGELAGFDVAVITVPTPLREGAPDLSYVGAAGETLARVLRAGALVILESTTYPGTTEEYLCPILEQSGLRSGKDFYVGYSPERIDPGNKQWTFVNTPKVVAGIDNTSRRLVEQFYGALVDRVVPVNSTAEAELVKVLENTYRHVNIALVNELAMFAKDLGVDVWTAIDAASTKPFGFTAFRPGPGVGGHCLPIDPSYLSWRVRQRLGQAFRFVELANDINEHMPDYVVRRIISMLNDQRLSVNGTRILLLGLTYKAGTSDWRESPSLPIAERLLELGGDVQACDPHIPDAQNLPLEVPFVDFGRDSLAAADLVVVLVDHPEFDAAAIAEHAPAVFDAKGLLAGHEFEGESL